MKQKGSKCRINNKLMLKKTKVLKLNLLLLILIQQQKKLTNYKFDLDKPFQEILYRIVNWINGKFGWIIESVVSQYINISTLLPLIGRSYIKSPAEVRSSK